MGKLMMTKSDKEWQAEEDARTLATATEIAKDAKRRKAALDAAKKMEKEARERVVNVQVGMGKGKSKVINGSKK